MYRRFQKALHSENSISGATAILVVTLILSNILGMLRDHFLAGKIATYHLDIYYAAFKIPDLLFNVLILGAVSSVFIPILTEKISHNLQDEAKEIAQKVMTAALFFTIVSATILFLLMPYLIPLLVPKFGLDRLAMTIKVARILMLTPVFFSISYTISGVLNSYKRFLAYSLAPLVYNFTIIIGVLLFSDRFSVVGVAWAVAAGSVLHALVQYPSAKRAGFSFKLKNFWGDRQIRNIFRLMIPRSIGLGMNQITLFAFTAISSALAAGSIAIYTFADNIQTVPVVVFGTSVVTALFPTLAEQAAREDRAQFYEYFIRAFRAIIYIMLPVSLLIYLLSNQIVRLILGSGKFTLFDTSRASATLAAFALAITFEALLGLLIRSFFAWKNTRLPMFASIISTIFSIILGFIFSRGELGVAGLALGLALGNLISVIYLFYLFDRKIIKVDLSTIKSFIFRIIISTALAGSACYLSKIYLDIILNLRTFVGVFLEAAISGGIGIITYFIITKYLKVSELSFLSQKILNKFKINGGSQ